MSTEPCSSTPARMRPSTYSRERSSRIDERHAGLAQDVAEQQTGGAGAHDRDTGAHVLPPFAAMGSVPIVAPDDRARVPGSSTQWKDYSGRQPSADEIPRAAIRTPSGNCGSSRRSVWAMIDTAATTSPLASRTGAATENAPGVNSSTVRERPVARISASRRAQFALGRDRVRLVLLEPTCDHLVEDLRSARRRGARVRHRSRGAEAGIRHPRRCGPRRAPNAAPGRSPRARRAPRGGRVRASLRAAPRDTGSAATRRRRVLGRRTPRRHEPHPDLVASVVASHEAAPLDPFGDETVRGRQRKAAALRDLGESQGAPALERVGDGEQLGRDRPPVLTAASRHAHTLRAEVPPIRGETPCGDSATGSRADTLR